MRPFVALAAAAVLAWGVGPARADDPPAPGPGGKPPGEKPPQEKPAERGYLGFQPAAIPLLSAQAREGLRVTTKFFGVVVLVVTPHMPAEQAGLQRGDLLLKFAGKEMPDTQKIDPTDGNAEKHFADAFKKLTEGIKPGDTVEFVVDRRGKEMVISVVAVDRATMEKVEKENKEAGKPKPTEPKPTEPKPTEPKPTEPKPTEPTPAPTDRGYIGFEVRAVETLNSLDRKRWKVTAAKGVVAVNVLAGAPGDKAGLRSGDVLVKFAGVTLPTPKELEEAKSAKDLVAETLAQVGGLLKVGADVEIVVERDGAPVTLKAVAVDRAAIEKLRAAAGDDDAPGKEAEKPEKPEKGEKPEKPEKPG